MSPRKPIVIGRYLLLDELAAGGMATVYLGRLLGPAGFSRTVAIKRLHPHLARDPEFVTMLLDEARLAGRIQHPNVAATLDIVAQDGELFVVMEYLHGETLSRLLRVQSRKGEPVPLDILSAILSGALHGLHAAHEVRGERGEPLSLVHRDVSPQNIMVRHDGVGIVVDFGVAKAAGRINETEHGKVKGKLPYMAPEQVRGQPLSRRTDLYAAGAVLWEALVGERLIRGNNEGEIVEQLLFASFDAPSARRPDVPPALDAVVQRALSRPVDARFATAREMALALEEAVRPALPSRVASWLEGVVGEQLEARASRLAEIETGEVERLTDSNSVMALLVRSSGSHASVPDGPPADPAPPARAPAASAPSVHDTPTAVTPAEALPPALAAASSPAAREPAASVPTRADPPPAALAALGAPGIETTSAGATTAVQAPPDAPGGRSRNLLTVLLAMVAVAAVAFAIGSRRPAGDEAARRVAPTVSVDRMELPPSATPPATSAPAPPATAPPPAPTTSTAAPASAAAAASVRTPPRKTPRCSDVRQVQPNGHIVYKRECL